MGILFSKPPYYENLQQTLTPAEQRERLQVLFDNVINTTTLAPYIGVTVYGNIQDRYRTEHTAEMREFVQRALDDDELIVEMCMFSRWPKSKAMGIEVKIMESAEQERMLRGLSMVPGKALKLELVGVINLELEHFTRGGWFGSYYNDGLCAKFP